MLTAEKVREFYWIAEQQPNAQLQACILGMAGEVTRRAETARAQLIEKCEYLVRDLGRAVEKLRQGETVNSLGVCQSAAGDIDRLCGELSLATEFAGRLQRDAVNAGLLPE